MVFISISTTVWLDMGQHTVAEDLPTGQNRSKSYRKRSPFLLDNERSYDEESGGDIDPIDLVGGEGAVLRGRSGPCQ